MQLEVKTLLNQIQPFVGFVSNSANWVRLLAFFREAAFFFVAWRCRVVGRRARAFTRRYLPCSPKAPCLHRPIAREQRPESTAPQGWLTRCRTTPPSAPPLPGPSPNRAPIL